MLPPTSRQHALHTLHVTSRLAILHSTLVMAAFRHFLLTSRQYSLHARPPKAFDGPENLGDGRYYIQNACIFLLSRELSFVILIKPLFLYAALSLVPPCSCQNPVYRHFPPYQTIFSVQTHPPPIHPIPYRILSTNHFPPKPPPCTHQMSSQ